MSKTVWIVAALAVLAGAPHAGADVSPGDQVSKADLETAKDVLTPGLEWFVRQGAVLNVVETEAIPTPEAFRAATEKYASQVKLSADGKSLENYVAGLPFPALDPADPQVAQKIMWNYEYGWFYTDDIVNRNYASVTGPVEGDSLGSIERVFIARNFFKKKYDGRLYLDPKPREETADGRRWSSLESPVVEPFDLKGVGGLTYRYLDSTKPDDTWIYLPSIRRTRRFSTTQRSESVFGLDWDQDSYFGYSGHIAWTEWKLIGEREILGIYHARHMPADKKLEAMSPADERWEKRRVWVVEGVSLLPQYLAAKRVLYIDKETWTVSTTDLYDRRGELWKIVLNPWAYRKTALEGTHVYEDEVGFQPWATIVDVQAKHGTVTHMPYPERFPQEPGWYFNLGEEAGVKEELFTIAQLIAFGR